MTAIGGMRIAAPATEVHLARLWQQAILSTAVRKAKLESERPRTREIGTVVARTHMHVPLSTRLGPFSLKSGRTNRK